MSSYLSPVQPYTMSSRKTRKHKAASSDGVSRVRTLLSITGNTVSQLQNIHGPNAMLDCNIAFRQAKCSTPIHVVATVPVRWVVGLVANTLQSQPWQENLDGKTDRGVSTSKLLMCSSPIHCHSTVPMGRGSGLASNSGQSQR